MSEFQLRLLDFQLLDLVRVITKTFQPIIYSSKRGDMPQINKFSGTPTVPVT
jgi:hypothetical protein